MGKGILGAERYDKGVGKCGKRKENEHKTNCIWKCHDEMLNNNVKGSIFKIQKVGGAFFCLIYKKL